MADNKDDKNNNSKKIIGIVFGILFGIIGIGLFILFCFIIFILFRNLSRSDVTLLSNAISGY